MTESTILFLYGKIRVREIRIRGSHPEVFLGKSVLKICSKFTGEHPCRSVISIKLLCNFIKITLRHGCSPVNLLHIFSEYLFLRIPLDGCFCRILAYLFYTVFSNQSLEKFLTCTFYEGFFNIFSHCCLNPLLSTLK